MNSLKISSLIVIIGMTSCSLPTYTNLWQSDPVKIDGKDVEWALPLRYYDSGSKLQYTVSNDNRNLYLCIRATDEQTQAKIVHTGMEVWIDTTGKNKHQVGIAYPLINSLENVKQPLVNPSDKKRFTDEFNEMQLIGFKSPIGGLTSILDNSAVNLKMSLDNSGILIYEISIPFKTFYKEQLLAADSNKLIGLTLIINGLSTAKVNGHSPSKNGKMGGIGGVGMRKGGGRTPMGGSGGDNNGSSFLEPNTIKLKIKLVNQPTN